MSRRSQPPYPPELRERAVRMVAEVESDYDSPWAAMNAVATKLGVGTGETVRKWVRQAEVDGGKRTGLTTEERARMKELERENRELRRANEGLQQFVRIGKHAMIGGKTGVDRDIIPYGAAQGNRAHLTGLNLIGLKRRGFSRSDIQKLRAAFGLLFSQDGTMADRLNEVADIYADQAGVMDIVNFIRADSARPLCSPSAATNGNGS